MVEDFPRKHLDRVWGRLKFIEKLMSVHKPFSDANLCYTNGPNSFTQDYYKHYIGLIQYLTLTCFDLLGHPEEFVPLNQWLRSSGVVERSQRLDKEGLSSIQVAKALEEAHREKFGVRRSFFRFIDDVLPPDRKNCLLSSIKKVGKKSGEFALSEKQAKGFLYFMRNNFTHNLIPGARLDCLISPNNNAFDSVFGTNVLVLEGEDIVRWGLRGVYEEEKAGEVIEWSVWGWPFLLLEVLMDVIGSRIEINLPVRVIDKNAGADNWLSLFGTYNNLIDTYGRSKVFSLPDVE